MIGCCSKFKECSDLAMCVHEGTPLEEEVKDCYYKENLMKGENFYTPYNDNNKKRKEEYEKERNLENTTKETKIIDITKIETKESQSNEEAEKETTYTDEEIINHVIDYVFDGELKEETIDKNLQAKDAVEILKKKNNSGMSLILDDISGFLKFTNNHLEIKIESKKTANYKDLKEKISEKKDSKDTKPEERIIKVTYTDLYNKAIKVFEEENKLQKYSPIDYLKYQLTKKSHDITVPAIPIIEYLIAKCEKDKEFAKRISIESKTIKRCLKYVLQEVRKLLNNRSGYLKDEVVYEIVENFYILDNVELDEEVRRKKAKKDKGNKKKSKISALDTLDTLKNETKKTKSQNKSKAAKLTDTGQISLFDFN